MLIQDLSKELDTKEMTAVHGGAGPGSSLNSNNNVTVSQSASQYVNQNDGDFLGLFFGRFPELHR
jgi:hypothetical protein